ncbi:hypothetical protein CsSME_00052134 [Camellia sinensis var. sinensis]
MTAEMEPIEIGNKSENLYDCYTLSRIEAVPSPSGGKTSQIRRMINWVTLNPYAEIQPLNGGSNSSKKEFAAVVTGGVVGVGQITAEDSGDVAGEEREASRAS